MKEPKNQIIQAIKYVIRLIRRYKLREASSFRSLVKKLKRKDVQILWNEKYHDTGHSLEFRMSTGEIVDTYWKAKCIFGFVKINGKKVADHYSKAIEIQDIVKYKLRKENDQRSKNKENV